MPTELLLITGGGTGGHVSPGLGVAAEWMRRHGPDSVAWVGRAASIEEDMAGRAGLPFHAVESAAFKRQWARDNLSIPGVLLAGLRQANALLTARPPAAVLMTGGYVGLPLSLAALRARRPLVLLEPNAVPGLANRLLKPLAAGLCLGWPPETPPTGSVSVTGIPCRLGSSLPAAREARLALRLDSDRRTLLVLPGSQAARAVNAALRAALPALRDRADLWQWIWMCGAAEEAECRAAAAAAPFPVQVHSFIHDTATAYAAADLVLCRSGASTLAELGVAGKPSLQVPYPHATGDHQRANAAAFARNGAAELLDELDLSPASLERALRGLMDQDLAAMAAAALSLGQPHAAERVTDVIEKAAGLRRAKPSEPERDMFNKLMKLHFVGIGGSGMSGIAEVLLTLGYPVTGSDKSDSEAVRRLRSLGAQVHVGHAAAHVGDAEGVVISNAVPETNPEVLEARRRKIPVIPRAQMLNELMRLKYGVCIAGTHGKTTTTSMTALILDEGGLDPTIVIGGVLDALGGSNARLGKGDYFVVEACEAYASFLQLNPAVAVVTNIDNDHLDHYQNMDNLRDAFVRFVNRLPFYGFALMCGDDPGVQEILGRLVRRAVTYGFGERNDLIVRLKESGPEGSRFALVRRGHSLGEAHVRLPGRHNVLNAAAALGVALELGIPFETAVRGLERFTGVRRRFQSKGEAGGVRVVDDYAHHPTELRATLQAAREAMDGKGRLLVAFQPHLYTRTQLLYRDFAAALEGADQVFLAGIYAARETPIPGVSSQLIADLLQEKGRLVTYREQLDALVPEVAAALRPGDLFLTAGAGSIDQLGDRVLERLKKEGGAPA